MFNRYLAQKRWIHWFAMNLKYTFTYTVCMCTFGICLFVIVTQAWLKISQRRCYSFDIDLDSTKKFKEALAMKERFKWIDDFQPIANDNMQVYSAFAEGQDKVRVIGITNDTEADLYCILWYNGKSSVTTKLVKAYIANINENHGKRVTAAYFLCYLCDLNVPNAVSVVQTSALHNPRNILPVHVIHEQEKTNYFTMCLSPMHASFKDSGQLLEWIELNKILGVERFVIYVNNVSSEVRNALQFYQESDVMFKVLPWSLSKFLCDGVQLHYCGQLAALNDCLYRSKGYSRYIATADLDEFIIPQHKDDVTWLDMLLRVPDQSVYLFGNSFVMMDGMHMNNNMKGETLMTDNLMRDDFIYGPRDRSKMIAWTDDIVTFGIHEVWALRKGDEYYVDPSVGLLHHYRRKNVTYPDGVIVKRFKSNVTLKYSIDLKKKIDLAKEKIFNKFT